MIELDEKLEAVETIFFLPIDEIHVKPTIEEFLKYLPRFSCLLSEWWCHARAYVRDKRFTFPLAKAEPVDLFLLRICLGSLPPLSTL